MQIGIQISVDTYVLTDNVSVYSVSQTFDYKNLRRPKYDVSLDNRLMRNLGPVGFVDFAHSRLFFFFPKSLDNVCVIRSSLSTTPVILFTGPALDHAQ